jgi:hypothetical protein
MLDKETIADLLGLVESEAVDVPALPVLQSIVQFGIAPDAGADLGHRIIEQLDVPAGTAQRLDYLLALSELNVPEAAERLRTIARDMADPHSFVAARLLGPAPEEAGDPVGPHVPLLIGLAKESGDIAALRELACLPLGEYDVPLDAFDRALSSSDVEERLWASIAVAKLGDQAPLLRVLDDLAEHPPPWMWGDPWTPYDILSKARPVPEEVRDALIEVDEEELARDQKLLVWALTGMKTAEGTPIEEPTGEQAPISTTTGPEATALVEAVLKATSDLDLQLLPHESLRLADTLEPAQQAEIITRLVEACLTQQDPQAAMSWGNATMNAIGRATRLRLDPDRIVASFLSSEHPAMDLRQLGAVLGRADDDGVVQSLVRALGDSPAGRADELVRLLEQSSHGELVYLGAGGSGASPPLPPPPAPPAVQLTQSAPPPENLAPDYGAPSRSGGFRWPKPWRRRQRQQAPSPPDAGVSPQPASEVTYTAYPCIDVDDDVVIVGQEFSVTIGLAGAAGPGVAFAGPIVVKERFPIEDLEVELVVDPDSLEVIDGGRVFGLRVTALDDFPVCEVRMRARYVPGLEQDRRISTLYRRRGRVVGFALRLVRVVENAAAHDRSSGPAPIKESVLDLSPLVDDGPPDLLLCLFRGDKSDSYVWGVYPRSGAVPDLRRGGVLAGARDFATYTQRAIRSKDFKGLTAYDQLVGYGTFIDEAMPQVVTDSIRAAVAASPDRAPSIMLLTQEPFIPWELAVPNPRLSTAYGGEAPFLGAHVAISRWPLSENRKPELTRIPALAVSRQAAMSADYTGVKAWAPLKHARAEVRELVKTLGMTEVSATRSELRACLTGETAYDVIHVALHGQRDPQGLEDGLVLVEPDAAGNPTPSFFNATQVIGLENRASRPFVFLNACQVGSGDAILGTYAGFATSLLRTRASAVVAPLWNVDDEVAARVTRDFYAEAYAADPVPVAEILRKVRAEFTEAGVRNDSETCTPTLIAYQCFGHPQFTLRRQPS